MCKCHQAGLLSLSGKSELAAALCYYYDADYLSIDAVVKEAIADDGSEAGLRARELCIKAAEKLEDKEKGSKEKCWSQSLGLRNPP